MVSAKATTDESGNRIPELGTTKNSVFQIGDKKKDVFDVRIEYSETILSTLFGSPTFDFISRKVFDEGVPADAVCLYGKTGTTRSIKFKSTDYRSSSYFFYINRSKQK